MKHKINRILVIGTLIFAFLFISVPITTSDVNKDVKISSTYVPEGLIAMWSGPLDSIPDGWVLCDGTQFTPNTSDRFILNTDGIEAPGTIGGDHSHSHSYTEVPLHDHGSTGITDCTHTHTYQQSSSTISNGVYDGATMPAMTATNHISGSGSGQHLHTTTTTGVATGYTSETDDIYPPYYELAFIKKITNDPIIPVGIIMVWPGVLEEIPDGWAVCNGSQSTPDLEGQFIKGTTIDNPGLTSGNLTHTHTYTDIPSHHHTTTIDGASHTHSCYCQTTLLAWGLTTIGYPTMSSTNTVTLPHTHSMTSIGQASCTTEESNHQPPYTTVAFIMNTQESEGIPTGCISMWDDTVANIPYGWGQCDGTSDTIDLRESFLKASSLLEPIGTTGGSLTHTHVYTEVPLHGHSIVSANMQHSHPMYEITSSLGINNILGDRTIFSHTTTSSNTGISDATHSHDLLPTGIASPETAVESNLPPSIELIFIQQLSPITTVGWVSPAEDATLLFGRVATVQFDFEYSWVGLGNDITLSFTNGTDIHDAGSVLGLDHVFIPYLAGDVDATFHVIQDATELTFTTRSFFFYNNRDPTVSMVNPNGGETISGDELIEWLGSDIDGDQIHYQIEYNREDTGWVLIAAGETGTSYLWDTTTLTDSDSVKVRVIATDVFDGQAIDESDATFVIDNTPDDNGNGEPKKEIPGYNTVILLTLILLASALLAWKRRK